MIDIRDFKPRQLNFRGSNLEIIHVKPAYHKFAVLYVQANGDYATAYVYETGEYRRGKVSDMDVIVKAKRSKP